MLALFVWLKVGIEVDRLALGEYTVERLYIKLDKKLILKAKNITLPPSEASSSPLELDETFDRMKYLLSFFETIELNHIQIQEQTMTLFYAEGIFYGVLDGYEIAGTIHRLEDNSYHIDIPLLYAKAEQSRATATLHYQPNEDHLWLNASFDLLGITGELEAHKRAKKIDFTLHTDRFKSLRKLIAKTPLSETIKAWIVDKITADSYELYTLSGKGVWGEEGFEMDMDSLEGKIGFNHVTIAYKEGLSPVLADSFLLRYHHGGLYFDLDSPRYEGRDLNGSKITILNLTNEETPRLILDLKIKSQVDAVVQKILNAYHLTIPVLHDNPNTELAIWIAIPLTQAPSKLTVKVDVVLGEGNLSIGRVTLPVKAGSISYREGHVRVERVWLKSSWYEGNVSGDIALKEQNATLLFDAKEIAIGQGREKFLVIQKKHLPLYLDYRDRVKVVIPRLGLRVQSQPKGVEIVATRLKKLKPYLKNIGISLNDGRLSIQTKDFRTYHFSGSITRRDCFFYEKDSLCHTSIPCRGKVTPRGLYFYAFGKRLYYNAHKSRIRLTHLNIDLKKLLSIQEKRRSTKRKKLVVIGTNSQLRYGRYKLLTDSYDIEISPCGNIKAVGSLGGDIVKFTQKGKRISLQALRIKDKLLQPLIGFKGLQRGRYSLKQSGNPNGVMRGRIIVEGGVISNFKVYNNLLALINTLPALATLSSPGFSEKGFRVKSGVVEYRMIGDKVFFDSIYIKGKSATIVGKGEVNLKTKRLKMNLAIQTAREFGKVVGSIPLLGYIIMGKDKSMTVGLRVTGTLNRPKVKTSAMDDILSLPLKLLKRTLEAPRHIINK